MSKLKPLDVKNILSISAWWKRWTSRGGSFHWQARPMDDLRNDDDRRRYREIEFKRRHGRGGQKVVSFAAWKPRRVRRTG